MGWLECFSSGGGCLGGQSIEFRSFSGAEAPDPRLAFGSAGRRVNLCIAWQYRARAAL